MRATRGIGIAMGLGLVAVSPAGAASIEAWTPPAFSAVHADHISVVGTASAPRVILSLAGRAPETLVVQRGIFHARTPLVFGFNEIYLHTDRGDTLWLATVRLPLLATVRQSRVRYPKYTFHGDSVGQACTPCHGLAPFTTDGAPLPDSLCRTCHPPDLEWTIPHRPAARGQCQTCHGDGAIPTARPTAQVRLCQECHRGKIEEFNKAYQHGPVAAGSCLACHNPHGSEFAYGLRLPVESLCSSCHERVESEATGQRAHAPFRNGECTACHDPHATNHEWGLSRRSDRICLSCHREEDMAIWHPHPTQGKPRFRDREIVALNARGRLECISCHDPHFSSSAQLLRTEDSDTCRGCHADK